MRLAVVASHPIQYQAPLFRELAGSVELTVLFCHKANGADQSEAGFGVAFDWDVDLISGYESRFLKNVARNPSLTGFSGCDNPEVEDVLRSGGFDGVLVLGWHLKCFWQAIWAAKMLGIPLMVRGDSHLSTPRSPLKKVVKALTYPILLRIFDAALYVGSESKEYWRAYKYPARRMFFSPHSIDNDWFRARSGPEVRQEFRAHHAIGSDENVVLFAGKLVEIKRPLDVIDSVSILSSRGMKCTVLVAGSGPLAEAISDRAASCGVRLIELGFCNQSAMPSVYAAADVLVLPSESETWGLVANESLACGCPIVISEACGCAADLTDDGSVGRTYPTADVMELAQAIEEILKNRPSIESMNGKTAVFSIYHSASGIFEALNAVIRSRLFK